MNLIIFNHFQTMKYRYFKGHKSEHPFFFFCVESEKAIKGILSAQ